MKNITINAPAKINLWLDIAARRPDGYHDIESVMQTVTLFDELTIEVLEPIRGTRRISVSCSVDSLACDESNLSYRAAQEFFRAAGTREYNVSIHIEKRIPIAAGLAGGSSDAAATLIGLSRLCEAGFDTDKLCEIGRGLGADVPFCVRRGISVTRGIGDRFSDCKRLPDCKILIACDGEGVSTPWAYHRLDEIFDFEKRGADVKSFTRLFDYGLPVIASGMSNIFESAVLPVRERAKFIKRVMSDCGALTSIMSGSGPSVFGIFDDTEKLESAAGVLTANGIRPFICEPCYES